MLEGSIIVHTEFYDPVTLHTGEGIYIDSNMGHAYVADEGCDEALVLGVCSSADESLMNSLMNIHEPISVDQPAEELRVTPVRVRRLDRVRDGMARMPPVTGEGGQLGPVEAERCGERVDLLTGRRALARFQLPQRRRAQPGVLGNLGGIESQAGARLPDDVAELVFQHGFGSVHLVNLLYRG